MERHAIQISDLLLQVVFTPIPAGDSSSSSPEDDSTLGGGQTVYRVYLCHAELHKISFVLSLLER